mgnify:CR=1 FL=1
MPHIPRSVPPAGLMGFRKSVLVALVVLVVLVGVAAAWVVQRLTHGTARAAVAPLPPVATVQHRKAILLDEPRTYDAIPKPKPPPALPPTGIPVARLDAAVRAPESPAPARPREVVAALPVPPGPSQAEIDARIRAGIAEAKVQMLEEQSRLLHAQLMQGAAPGTTPGATAGTPGAAPGSQAPPKPKAQREWDWLARGKGRATQGPAQEAPGRSPGDGQTAKDGAEIIHSARWALPAQPLLTIYKSMELPGRLKRSVNSDIPGIALCELSIPIYDKFHYGQLILDKGSILVLKQEGTLSYGQSRIRMKLDQIEPPSGEVIVATAIVEDAEGKTGLSGRLNNHVLKLVGATAINALLTLGTQGLAGTPGRGQYFENPAQVAARDVTSSTSRDIRTITDAQLRVPPTVEIDAGTVCLVQLDENVQFSKQPVVVP